MTVLRDWMRGAVRRTLGWQVLRIGEHAYAALPEARLHEAWFSLEVQRRLLLQRAGVDLVVDVGANVGQFGRAIRRVYAGELVSFEPSSGAYAELAHAAAADGRWRAEHLALGAEAAELELRIAPLSVLNSFLPPSGFNASTFGERGRPTATERVPVRRMDDALAPHAHAGRRLFVKLDTQGFDLQVFAGMTALLPQVAALQSEISLRALYEGMPDWLESLAVYQRAGFRVIGMFPAASGADGQPIEFDCLMARDTAAAPA